MINICKQFGQDSYYHHGVNEATDQRRQRRRFAMAIAHRFAKNKSGTCMYMMAQKPVTTCQAIVGFE